MSENLIRDVRGLRRAHVAALVIIALALAASLAVAAAVVSIGIARADGLAPLLVGAR